MNAARIAHVALWTHDLERLAIFTGMSSVPKWVSAMKADVGPVLFRAS
nr:hypothetical protein [Marinicella sp. W31]MDC2879401.1 hypothetical protein [Marinicella sp. W31]